ncbi:MAG: DNA gyrase inhibitor YacG [Ectothiorhodospiraceae bacterium]
MSKPATVTCPTCGKPVEWSERSTYRPFCSKRCKLVDLGEWLDESRRIPGPWADESAETPPDDSG